MNNGQPTAPAYTPAPAAAPKKSLWQSMFGSSNTAASGGRRRTRNKNKCSKRKKRSYKGGNNPSMTLTTLGYSNVTGGKKTRRKRNRKGKCKK
jgi:hypothetical protein